MNHVLRVTEHPVAGWHITNTDGQITAWVDGEQHDAVRHAHHLLDEDGVVAIDDP